MASNNVIPEWNLLTVPDVLRLFVSAGGHPEDPHERVTVLFDAEAHLDERDVPRLTALRRLEYSRMLDG